MAIHSFFSVQCCDQETGYVVHELYLDDFEGELAQFILEKKRALAAGQSAELDRDRLMQYQLFRERIGDWTDGPIRLFHESSELPYRVHGGREFDLMLKGLKPLSVFSLQDYPPNIKAFLQRYFDPLVTSGKLVSGELTGDIFLAPATMYALPEEGWRIEAYRLMASASRISAWNDTLEFMQGSLLGYSSEENRLWAEYRRSTNQRWGLHCIYRPIEEGEVELIRKTGCKVFVTENEKPIRIYLPYDSPGKADDPGSALARCHRMAVARFYVPATKFRRFSQGVIRNEDIDYEVFEIPGAELPQLNAAIDGTIEIRGWGPAAATNLGSS
jgi:hypothetical protein